MCVSHSLRPKPPLLSGEAARRLREEALRLQEEREEAELKDRRRATLERLVLRSRLDRKASQKLYHAKAHLRGTEWCKFELTKTTE